LRDRASIDGIIPTHDFLEYEAERSLEILSIKFIETFTAAVCLEGSGEDSGEECGEEEDGEDAASFE
jgi:hypothetical protein